jgi:hypothetical protein
MPGSNNIAKYTGVNEEAVLTLNYNEKPNYLKTSTTNRNGTMRPFRPRRQLNKNNKTRKNNTRKTKANLLNTTKSYTGRFYKNTKIPMNTMRF